MNADADRNRFTGGTRSPFPLIAARFIRRKLHGITRTIILPFWCATHILFAQQHPFHRYSTADGLSQNYITALAQDERGFIWAGTAEAGLNRFDGREFRIYDLHAGLPSNTISALAASRGHLFIGMPAGLFSLSLGATGYDTPDSLFNNLFSRIDSPVLRLQLKQGDSLYIETKDGAWIADLWKYRLTACTVESGHHEGVRRTFPGIGVRDAVRDGVGDPWYATDRGVVKLTGGKYIVYNTSNGLPVEDILAVMHDREGVCWIASANGLFSFVPGRFLRFTNGRELPAEALGVWEITEAPDGTILFGTIGAGIVHWKNNRFSRLTVNDGLPSNSVSDILFIAHDTYICATPGGIVFVTDGKPTRTLTESDGLPGNAVEFIVSSRNGGFWFSTHKGLTRYVDGDMRTYTTRDGLPSNRITQIAEDSTGALWIGTHAGASLLRPGGHMSTIEPLKGIQIVSVFIDRQDHVWFGTLGAGVFGFSDTSMIRLTRDDGLGGNTIYFITEDHRGNLYFGTNGGVSIAGRRYLHRLFPAVWSARKPDETFDAQLFRKRLFHTLTSASGLTGEEMNSGAVFIDSRRDIWFGSMGGATCYTPLKGNKDLPPNILLLTELKIGANESTPRNMVDIPAGVELLIAKCVLCGFRNPDQIRYFYRMENLETSWHESDDGKIIYSGLTSGTYRLLVCATVGEGIWTETLALLEVGVRPHYYETPLFWILIVIMMIAVGFGVHRFRLRHALEVERVRTRIASDLHDDIGATLSSAALLSDLERLDMGNRHQSTERVERISQLLRSAASSMNDIVWAVNPRNDTIEAVLERMRSFVENAAAAGTVVIKFEHDDLSGLRLRADKRKNLLLSCKEAVNNAVKHANCNSIMIHIGYGHNKIVLTVRDNGNGFDTTKIFEGNGLITMRQRAESMGGSCVIESGSEGTTVLFTVPL